MPSFEKYLAAKNRLQESGRVSKRLNQNYLIRKELEALNEDMSYSASSSGGEVDNIMAAVGAAALIAMKSIYNGAVYAKLKAELPKYLEQYKITGAGKSREVWDYNFKKKQVELKKQKATLLGSGGSRDDKDAKGKEEESAKDKVEKIFKQKKEALTAMSQKADDKQKEAIKNKKEQLDKQEEEAKKKIDLKIQQLQKAIDTIEDGADVQFDKAKEKFRQYDEAFKKKTDGFLEVSNSPLASSWKKKWEKEFTIAKKEAEIEVLAEAKKIATEANDKKEIEAITQSEARDKEAQAAAEEALGEIQSDADKAEDMQASASEFGVDAFMGALMADQQTRGEIMNTWQKEAEKGDKEDGGDDGGGKKEKLESQIKNAEDKLNKAKDAVIKLKNDGKEESAKKAQDQVTKIESDIAKYKEELSAIKDSNNYNDYYSLSTRVFESMMMIDNLHKDLGLNEAEEKMRLLILRVLLH